MACAPGRHANGRQFAAHPAGAGAYRFDPPSDGRHFLFAMEAAPADVRLRWSRAVMEVTCIFSRASSPD